MCEGKEWEVQHLHFTVDAPSHDLFSVSGRKTVGKMIVVRMLCFFGEPMTIVYK